MIWYAILPVVWSDSHPKSCKSFSQGTWGPPSLGGPQRSLFPCAIFGTRNCSDCPDKYLTIHKTILQILFAGDLWPTAKRICRILHAVKYLSWHPLHGLAPKTAREGKRIPVARLVVCFESPHLVRRLRSVRPSRIYVYVRPIHISIYTYVCISLSLSLSVYIYIYMYIYIYIYIYTCVYIYIYIYIYICIIDTHIYISLSLSLYIYIYIHTYVYIYIYICNIRIY